LKKFAILGQKSKALLTYFLTYAMEQSLLEKLNGFQLVKKLPAFYGT